MDQPTYQNAETSIQILGRKSRIPYINIAVFSLIFLCIDSAIMHRSAGIGILIFILIFAYTAYRIAETRSYRLYCNDSGVWLESGILPWKKGVRGVMWRDLEGATFFQSFGSWVFKSYRIRVGHRFTRGSEIIMTDVSRGNDVVTTINQMHQELARRGALR